MVYIKTKSPITSNSRINPSNILSNIHLTTDLHTAIEFFGSGNGTFVGVGTAEGDISVYIAWSLAVSVDLKLQFHPRL